MHTLTTVIMVAIPTAAATVIMVAIPTAILTLGHHHPTPTVATPITKVTSCRTVTATPSATKPGLIDNENARR
ncbi:MAG: hypothetical protein WBZ36_13590 [Candidatus Nitrosopolaris sp.]